jgi:L-lactate utilization protein LutC
LTAAGGKVHVVSDAQAAIGRIGELTRLRSARRILLGRGTFIDTLNLAEHLRKLGCEVFCANDPGQDDVRATLFAADLGITGVDFLVAETGSVVLSSGPGEPRSYSLLPPVHIAVAERQQLVPDLFDLLTAQIRQENAMPSCLSLITGPSKTGDIELRLVTGVHGPGEVHVILVDK